MIGLAMANELCGISNMIPEGHTKIILLSAILLIGVMIAIISMGRSDERKKVSKD